MAVSYTHLDVYKRQLIDIHNEAINIRNEIKMRNQSMNNQVKSISENEFKSISECSGVKTNDTGKFNENKYNESTSTKISDEFKTSSNYNDIIKNVVLESKINNNSGNEVLMEIQCNYERERE